MSAKSLMGATLGYALFSDANLRFPRTAVRLNPGIDIAVTADALVISGPSGRQQLKCGPGKGPQIAHVLQQLIDPVTRQVDLDKMDPRLLALLHAAGALDAMTDEADRLDGFAAFLSGSRDSARRFASGSALQRFVADRTTLIASRGRLDRVALMAAEDGLSVEAAETDSILEAVGLSTDNPLIDRLLDPRISDDYLLALVPEASIDGRKAATAWLIVAIVVNGSIVRLVLRGDRWFRHAPELCPSCCESLIDQVIERAQDHEPGDLEMACALQVQELVHLVAEVNERPADTALATIDGRIRPSNTPVLGYLSGGMACDACTDDTERAEAGALAAYVASTDFAERHVMDPKGHQVHYLASNLAAQGRPRASGVSPAQGPVPAVPAWLRPAVDAVELSVGIRRTDGPKPQRFTASGGNMGSTSALLEIDSTDGPCVFLYDDQHGRFIDTARAEYRELPGAGTGWRIHLIAGIGRLGPKYGQLAYRISLADAGVALASIQAIAQAQGLTPLTEWNEEPSTTEWERVLVGEGRHVATIRFVQEATS